VTHDRYLLDRVSTVVLGLDETGIAERFADYSQWAADQAVRKQPKPKATLPGGPAAAPQRKKLSYLESREYESIEQEISALEQAITKSARRYRMWRRRPRRKTHVWNRCA
jgi:ATP-binding cassette subfamily F protein uup